MLVTERDPFILSGYFDPLMFQLPLHWRHNGLDSVSNNQPHHCFLSRLFGRRPKETSKLSVTALCVGNSPVNSPHKWPVTRKMFPFDDVIMELVAPSCLKLAHPLITLGLPNMNISWNLACCALIMKYIVVDGTILPCGVLILVNSVRFSLIYLCW